MDEMEINVLLLYNKLEKLYNELVLKGYKKTWEEFMLSFMEFLDEHIEEIKSGFAKLEGAENL